MIPSKRAAAALVGLALAVVIPACTQVAGLDEAYELANQPCTSGVDCASGLCAGTPGFCAVTCDADADCPAGACIQNKAQLHICFPACVSDADCVVFGGTCQVGLTIGGVTASVCAG